MTITFAAAAVADPDAGWGRLIALMLTGLVFWAFTVGHKRWKETRKPTTGSPSQEKSAVTVTAVKPQLTATVDSKDPIGAPTAAVAVRDRTVVATRQSPVDEFVALRLGQMTTTQLVREAKRVLNVSDATAWRAIRKAKESTQ